MASSNERAQKGGLVKVLAPFIFDVAIPVALYYVLHDFEGVGNVWALTLGGVVPAVRTVVGIVSSKKTDGLAVLMTVLFVATLIMALISGNARFFLVKESFATGLGGLWILATSFRRKNLAYDTAKPFVTMGRPAEMAAWDRLADTDKKFRAGLRRISVLWGFGLIVEALARVYIALHYPVHDAVSLVNIPIIVIIVGLSIISGPLGGAKLKRAVDHEAKRQPTPEQPRTPAWM